MCPDARPANVVIYGFDQALASTISGAFDLFAQAGVTWAAHSSCAESAGIFS